MTTATKSLAAFLLGVILGSFVQTPLAAQTVTILFGSFGGVAKAISVDATGNVNAIVH